MHSPAWTDFDFFFNSLCPATGRSGGLMVSMLDTGLSGSCSSPGLGIKLCCVLGWLSQCLSPPQEYKWMAANCQGNLTKCWRLGEGGGGIKPSISPRGSSNSPSWLHSTETRISSWTALPTYHLHRVIFLPDPHNEVLLVTGSHLQAPWTHHVTNN